MNQLKQIFEYQGQMVRTILQKDEPWFVAKDIFEALGIKWKGNDSMQIIPDEWKGVRSFRTPGGDQQVVIINEAAVYKLAFRSNKPQAEAFTNWVASEVLPTLRKTGQYSLKNNPSEILNRHLIAANKLSKGLPKSDQLELRIIAVRQASEESGADYSDILAVLEKAPAADPSIAEADKFLDAIGPRLSEYPLWKGYRCLPPGEETRICEQLGLNRMNVLRELSRRNLIRTEMHHGVINFTVKSRFSAPRRGIQVRLPI